MKFKNNAIEQIKALMIEKNKSSGALFQGLVFGNAYDNEEIFIGEGEARKNEEVNENMYWRMASLTKLLASITLSAAIEDGLLSIDDPVYLYIPEIAEINQYIDSASYTGGTDKYGLPNYKMNLITKEGLGKEITIRDLLECRSGLGYQAFAIGSLVDLLKQYINTESGQIYTSWFQYLQTLISPNDYSDISGLVDNLTLNYYKRTATFTDIIKERFKHPLLSYPGTKLEYGADLCYISAAVGRALQLKGVNKTCSEYVSFRIFNPLEMKNAWLSNGSLNPPLDISEKLTSAFFVRQSNADGLAGPNVKFNKLYRDTDPEAYGDGFVYLTQPPYYQNQTKPPITDYLASGLDVSLACTLSDYCKIMKLIINKGIYINSNNVKIRILSEESVNFICNPKISINEAVDDYGPGTLSKNGIDYTWCGGISKIIEYNCPKLQSCLSYSSFYYNCFYNTEHCFDIRTGNYIVGGTQSAQNSWLLDDKIGPYNIDIIKCYSILANNKI